MPDREPHEPPPRLLQPEIGQLFGQQQIEASRRYAHIATNEPNSPQKQDKMTRATRQSELFGDLHMALTERRSVPTPPHLIIASQAVAEALTAQSFAGDAHIRVNNLFIALDDAVRNVTKLPVVRPWTTAEDPQQPEQALSAFLLEQITGLTGPGNIKLARAFYESLQSIFQDQGAKVVSPELREAIKRIGNDVQEGVFTNLYAALSSFATLYNSNVEVLNRIPKA